MTRSKILGLVIGASLLFGFEPFAEAALQWSHRRARSKCLRSLAMWFRRSLEFNAATRDVWSVVPIAKRVVRSVASIAMSVEKYVEDATEYNKQLRRKNTPRLLIRSRGVLLS